jgi:type II secretory pathway predicted ATPase ExeA/phage tail protein X
MYLKFYGLSEKPFSQTPDPRFLYWNDSYREALASLRYGIQERKGFLTMIGEAGTGKTTLLRKLLDDLGPDAVSVFLFNPNASFEEILEYTLSELGVTIPSGRKLAMLQRLNEFLLAAFAEGKNTILVIDEAQDLETEVLESLRLLSNLETAKEKILQIVLSGQTELAARLAQENLRQLKQRIAVRCRLEPLQRGELAEYIRARLRIAGREDHLFDDTSLDGIWGFANGIPRLVNTVCDNALLVGYAVGKQAIDRQVIDEVVQDLSRLDPGAADEPVLAEPSSGGPVPPRISPPLPGPRPAPERPPSREARAAPGADPHAPEDALRASPHATPEGPAPRSSSGNASPTPRVRASAREPARPTAGRRRAAVLFALACGSALLVAAGVWLGTRLRLEPTSSGSPGEGRTATVDRSGERLAAEVPTKRLATARAVPAAQGSSEGRPGAQGEIDSPNPPSAASAVLPGNAEPEGIDESPDASGAADGVETHAAVVGFADALSDRQEPSQEPSPVGGAASVPASIAEPRLEPAGPPLTGSPPSAPAASELSSPGPDADARPAPSPLRRSAARAVADHREPGPPPSEPSFLQDVQDSEPRVLAAGQRILVRSGDTLYQLAWRAYGTANFTTLDMLRAANPEIQDVNRILAGKSLVFPDPGPDSRLLDRQGATAVLAITTPAISQAEGVRRKLQEEFGGRAELELVTLAEGQRLYRVSLTDFQGESQARTVAEALGTILSDPVERPGP